MNSEHLLHLSPFLTWETTYMMTAQFQEVAIM